MLLGALLHDASGVERTGVSSSALLFGGKPGPSHPAQSGRKFTAALCDIAYSLKRRGAGKTRRDRTDPAQCDSAEGWAVVLATEVWPKVAGATGFPIGTINTCDSRAKRSPSAASGVSPVPTIAFTCFSRSLRASASGTKDASTSTARS